jgi:ferric-dicitrate binding protein FerR (iron transport regulator)
MSDSSKKHSDTQDIQRRVRELPAVEADADFRERLRSAFAEGRLEAEARSRPQEEPPPRDARAGRKPRFAWWHWMIPAAAAAVILIVVGTLNRAPELRVAQVTGHGDVRVDGSSIPLDDSRALGESIRPGIEIEMPEDAVIDLLAGDVILFEVTGGTRMSIPAVPNRWFGRVVECSLSVGEMRIKTGKGFPGSELLVMTPEGRVEISGTMVSIERSPGVTCVCVVEGIAHVGTDREDMQPVQPGYRKVMFGDGEAKIIPIEPIHEEGVLDFDSRVGDRIDTGK